MMEIQKKAKVLIITLTIISTSSQVGFSRDIKNIDCDNPRNQIEINECVLIRAHEAREELNKIYDAVLNNGDSMRRNRLEEYRKAWDIYSSAKCRLDVDIKDRGDMKNNFALGSMHGEMVNECIEKMTRDIIAELESIPPMKEFKKLKN